MEDGKRVKVKVIYDDNSSFPSIKIGYIVSRDDFFIVFKNERGVIEHLVLNRFIRMEELK